MHRYIVLKVLEWWKGEITFKELETWSKIEPKNIVSSVRDLLTYNCIYKAVNDEGYTTYALTDKGKKLIKYYEEQLGLKWTPPWKQ